jgi:hypothetical protein
MRWVVMAVIALATAAPFIAFAQTGVAFDFHVERLVATPTPVGPVLLASDAAVWNITLSDPTIVWMDVRSDPTSPFLLTMTCGDFAVTAPTSHDVRTCSRSGSWQVQVDPVAGVAVDIVVRFRGYASDVGGGASPFFIQTVANPDPTRCVVTGVCLP